MKTLEGKVIYVIGTGARKILQLPKAIKEFTEDGARVYIIMSEMGREICNANFSDFKIPGTTLVMGYSRGGEMLPLEDLVLVAPCTFNTLNKIAVGIADTYPTTIIASSIGKKRKVIIAPAMNSSMWEHPQTQYAIKKIQSWGCKIIYPDISKERVTMAPIEKIADTVFSNLAKVRYESERMDPDEEYLELVNHNYPEFRRIGETMADLDLTRGSAGGMSKKVKGGYLVTSTGSQVGSLSPDEITFVKGRTAEKVFWKGKKMPSSEMPLLLEIYSACPEIGAIIHGHCPRITYTDKMQIYTSEQYIRYGIFGEIKPISVLLKQNEGFCILKLHGEIASGDTLDTALLKLKNKLEEANG